MRPPRNVCWSIVNGLLEPFGLEVVLVAKVTEELVFSPDRPPHVTRRVEPTWRTHFRVERLCR